MAAYTPSEIRFIVAIAHSKLAKDFERLHEDYFHKVFITLNMTQNVEKVRDILKLANEAKLDLWETLEKRYPDLTYASSHFCLLSSPRCFALVVEFGGTSKLDVHACRIYLYRLIFGSHEDCFLREALKKRYKGVFCGKSNNTYLEFRSLQLLFLFISSVYGSLYKGYISSEFEDALQIVWSCVPDPLLTETEFTKCFDGPDPRCMPTILKAWSWFNRLMRDVKNPGKCPRSLRHLSRCATREKLKECFQLPDGVEKLDIPTSTKKYLLLKDFTRMN